MIDPKAVPIGNRNPYKRVDLAAKRRKATITKEEILGNIEREPDPSLYDYNPYTGNWHLKEST